MSKKIAYQTDAAGFFIGEEWAHECQIEPGVFHVPAGCTLTPPPSDIPEGKWPRLTGSKWQLVNIPKRVESESESPLEKLQGFLNANPEVLELLNMNK